MASPFSFLPQTDTYYTQAIRQLALLAPTASKVKGKGAITPQPNSWSFSTSQRRNRNSFFASLLSCVFRVVGSLVCEVSRAETERRVYVSAHEEEKHVASSWKAVSGVLVFPSSVVENAKKPRKNVEMSLRQQARETPLSFSLAPAYSTNPSTLATPRKTAVQKFASTPSSSTSPLSSFPRYHLNEQTRWQSNTLSVSTCAFALHFAAPAVPSELTELPFKQRNWLSSSSACLQQGGRDCRVDLQHYHLEGRAEPPHLRAVFGTECVSPSAISPAPLTARIAQADLLLPPQSGTASPPLPVMSFASRKSTRSRSKESDSTRPVRWSLRSWRMENPSV
jgi:hypothetical protein